MSETVSYKLRIKLFDKLSSLPIDYYMSHNYGELSTKIISDSSSIGSFLYTVCSSLVSSIVSIVFILVAMFLQSVILSAVILVAFVVYVVASFFVARRFKVYAKKGLVLSEKMQNNIKTSFDNAVLIKTFLIEQYRNSEFDALVTDTKKNNIKVKKVSNLFSVVTMAISTLALCVIYGAGALMVIDGMLTLGVVIAMGMFFQSLTMPIAAIISSNINYNQVKPSIQRINNLLSEDSEKGDLPIDTTNLTIKFDGVYFRYPNSQNLVLQDFSFCINSSGKYAIVGKSGGGKSTIAKLLLGIYLAQSGTIQVFGQDIDTLDKQLLRQNISYVEQDVELLQDSIINNLKVGNRQASIQQVVQVCQSVGIHQKISSLEQGYDSIINDKINLSGGEKRRLSIARALLKQAKIYIFDEPEVSIEHDFKEQLLQIIDKLALNSIVILITHNTQMIGSFDSIIYI